MPVQPVPRAAYDKYARAVRASSDYSDRIVAPAPGLTVNATNSIRRIVLKDKMISQHGALLADTSEIVARYRAGDSVLALSAAFGYAPVMVAKACLIDQVGRRVVSDLFAGRDVKLSARDREQWDMACAADIEAPAVQRRIAVEAMDAENAFVARFTLLGVGMKTQNDLVAEQTAEYGRAVCTPDILFTDAVWINDRRVFWIDFKNYAATPARFLLEGNRAQADKYKIRFGTGALAYSAGVVAGVKTSALMLDASVGITTVGAQGRTRRVGRAGSDA